MQKLRPRSTPREPQKHPGRMAGTAETPPSPSLQRRGYTADILIGLTLLVLTMVVYWSVRQFEFINYDDADYIVDNPRVQMGLTAENVAWAFRTFYFENWHPLTWLSYLLDYQIFGLNSGAFHLVNVAFHLLNTLLLLAVLKRMTGARWPSAFVAGVFALHPLHIESVAWVAERKDVLCAFFFLLTLWAYVIYVERPRWTRYVLALFLFALGLMAKPMVVTLPFVLLLLDFWPLRRFRFGSAPSSGARPINQSVKEYPSQSLPKLVFEKIPFLLLTLLACIVTFLAQHGARIPTTGLPLSDRIANALISYWRYLAKTLWPHDLAVFYPHPGQWLAWQIFGAGLILAAITFLVLHRRRQSPYLAIGWFWYLGMLVPVIGLVQVGEQSIADRYMYLPMIGLLLMFAYGAGEVAERWQLNKLALPLSGVALVTGCFIASISQIRVWKNSLTLFEHALAVTEEGRTPLKDLGASNKKSPFLGGVAHNSLGDALLSAGRTNEAMSHFLTVLERDPEDALAHGNLGNILLAQGKATDALAQYQQGLQFNPRNPELNHNAALALAQLGKFSEAIPYYRLALQLRAEYADAHLNLGNALAAIGQFDEAIAHFQEVLRLRPSLAAVHRNIANALTQQGKHQEATVQYLEVVRLQPGPEAHSDLALNLARLGKNSDAIKELQQAVRMKPEEAQFHFHLATVLQADKKPNEAITEYREALRLRPDLVLALNNLAWLLATHDDAKIRNGSEAITHATRACELTQEKQPFLLGTLAAAYAESGRFPEAVNTAQKAADLATAAGQKDVAAANLKLLQLYREGKPYHEGDPK